MSRSGEGRGGGGERLQMKFKHGIFNIDIVFVVIIHMNKLEIMNFLWRNCSFSTD